MYVSLSTISPVIPAVASVLYICFAVFGFFQYKKVEFFWSFQLYVIMLAVWSFGSFMMRSGMGGYTPLFWNRFMLIGMLTGPFALVHAIIDTLGIRNDLIRRLSRIAYVLVISLMYVNFSGMVVQDVAYIDGIFTYQLGSGAIKAYLTSYLYLSLMVILIIFELKKKDYDRRTRTLFSMYLLGMLIMLTGILMNLNEDIGRYPVDIMASMVNAVILFYGIYRYRLVSYTRLGLNVLSAALLLVLASFLYFIIFLFSSSLIPFVQPGNKLTLALIMGVVTVLVVYPLRLGAAYLIDRVIIPRRHPYQQKIRDLSQKLTTIIDLETLGREVIHSITSGIHVDWAVCLVKPPYGRESRGHFILLSQFRYKGPIHLQESFELSIDDSLAERLEVIKNGGSSSVLVSRENSGSFYIHDSLPGANILIPLMFKGNINGYIGIGAPWESKIFSQYEKDALEILAGQCALSLNNALSFERIKAQGNELFISNTKLEAIFNGIGTPLALTDIDFSIIEVNNAAVTFIGKKRDEIIGKKCYKLYFDSPKACSFCRAPEALRSGHKAESEAVSGERTYSLQFHPVKILHNSRQVFLEIIQDISEEKKMQDELLVSAKMAEIGSLAAGITHDLNNPLAGITGTAELMLSQLEESSPQTEYIQDILQYSRNAADVIREISLYARKGERDLISEEVDVVEALEFSLKLAARGMDMSNITIRRDYQDKPSIMSKKGELQQVYLNIIINALQAMDGQGVLKLTVHESYGVIHTAIADSGKGIPTDHLTQVFTPFFTTKEPGEGTGLGLSNCFRIIDKYAGRISVDSEEGKGSVFTVFFPSLGTSSEQVRFVLAEKQHHFNDVFYIQRKVLIGEKGYIEETIHRTVDEQAVHLLAYKGVEPVGTVSLLMTRDFDPLPVQTYFDIEPYFKDREHSAEIIRLAVLPEMRNTLVALGLVSLIFLYGRSKGMKETVIDVFAEDVKNIEMYKKFGFEIIGSYASPSLVTVMMQRDETPHEKDADKRARFVTPLFRRLYNMFDFGEQHQAVINEMKSIIPELGVSPNDSE